MDAQWAQVIGHGAVGIAWATGGVLTLGMLGAVTVPMHAPIVATLSRVWAWARRSLSVALVALFVVVRWCLGLPQGLAVTYVHTYRADRGTGRHYPGSGRRAQGAGRHRRGVMA
jgi:hypothetical protein